MGYSNITVDIQLFILWLRIDYLVFKINNNVFSKTDLIYGILHCFYSIYGVCIN